MPFVVESYDQILGTNGDDVILADFAAADALYEYSGGLFTDRVTYWDRAVVGYEGDDLIKRDRPGDYKDGPLGGNVQIFADSVNIGWFHHEAVYDGGYDTVSYAGFGAGVDVDLGSNSNYGIAKARWTPVGETIFGEDHLFHVESVIGTNYNDILRGDDNDNVLRGLHGDDWVEGGDGEDTLYGDEGDDTLKGGKDKDYLLGGDGYNTLYGQHGNDTLVVGERGTAYGGSGNDIIYGGNKADFLDGGYGDDTISAFDGNDTLTGGDGTDHLDGGDGYDIVRELANNGVIAVLLGNGSGTLTAYGETDTLVSIESFETGSGDDIFYFASGDQFVRSGGGNDFASMGDGVDRFWGGAGNDEAYGGDGNDFLFGEGNNDTLIGGAGEDDIRGGQGNDRIEGGADNDSLRGEDGADGFVFASANTGIDYIHDFVIGLDRIVIEPGFLADHPDPGESFVGKVVAHAAPLPPGAAPMTLLYADTVDGFRHFATLPNVHANQATLAIIDGSLFWTGGNGDPGGDWQMPDAPGEGLKGGGGLVWDFGAAETEAALMPDYIATDIPPMAGHGGKAGARTREEPAEESWFAATRIDDLSGVEFYADFLV